MRQRAEQAPPLRSIWDFVPTPKIADLVAEVLAQNAEGEPLESRVVTQDDLGDKKGALKLRLEMKLDNQWLPVVEYNIDDQKSGLKVYDLFGVREVVPLGLNTRAARELAENDITTNAQRYCRRFLKDQLAA